VSDATSITAQTSADLSPAEIRLVAPRVLRWHLSLLRLLQRDLAPRRIILQQQAAENDGSPKGVLLRRLAPGLAAAEAPDGIWTGATSGCVTVALGDVEAVDGPMLMALFDGRPTATSLLAALLAGRSPTLTVREGPSGPVLAAGHAGLDAATNLAEAVEAVTARMAALLSAALRGVGPKAAQPEIVTPVAAPGAGALMRDTARRLAFSALRTGFRLTFQPAHWCVGWRFVQGADAWDRGDLSGPPWRTLPSAPDRFHADPFPFSHGGQCVLFFETFEHCTRKGHIGAVAMGPKGPEGPVLRVLEEPWHLSYPFIIEAEGAVWMIPESTAARSVSLYRADPFPTRWVHEADLLTDIEASDATLLWHEGQYWMFATVRDGAGSFSDMLWIHSAPRLVGPWRAHRGNPVLVAGDGARPAGRFMRRDGRLFRPVQLCAQLYGAGVGLAEVTRLDEQVFTQVIRHELRPGPHWPGRRLHTLNRDSALEVIDGSALVLRRPSMRRRAG